MDIPSMVISLLGLLFTIITYFKLHIIYVPLLICELAGFGVAVTDKVMLVSCIVWAAYIIKSVINHFK